MSMCVLAQTQKLMEILDNRCISVAVGWFLGWGFFTVFAWLIGFRFRLLKGQE